MTEKRYGRVIVLIAALFAAAPLAGQPQTCPPEGTAKTTKEKALNVLKNRDDAPLAEQIDPNATLGAVLMPGNDLDRWSTDRGATFEGVVLKVKPGDPETPNCGATDPAHEDTHIELALDPTAPSTKRVIVEVTPRWREKMAVIHDWSTSALRQQLLGRRIQVTGWLLSDWPHKGQAENTHPNGASNWRATVWEIHPITGFVVLPGAAVAVPASTHTFVAHTSLNHRPDSKRKCRKSRGRACRKASRH